MEGRSYRDAGEEYESKSLEESLMNRLPHLKLNQNIEDLKVFEKAKITYHSFLRSDADIDRGRIDESTKLNGEFEVFGIYPNKARYTFDIPLKTIFVLSKTSKGEDYVGVIALRQIKEYVGKDGTKITK